MPDSFPALRAVVLDTTDARTLAEFYRALLGFVYRPGDEPPPAGEPDPKGADWLVLYDGSGGQARLAGAGGRRGSTAPGTWPAGPTSRSSSTST